MKKSILITATLAALAMLASCQKEQFTKNVTSATGVTEFTATIEQPTKTAISDEGKVTWVAGDTITVTDAAQKSAVYVASSAGASTTFTLKEGETAVGEGPYTATYGDIDNQVYDADAAGANCPLTAAQTSTTTFKFSSPYAVVKITAESEVEEVIKSVDVNFGDKTYTLNCGEDVTLSSEAIDFFVAVNQAKSASLSVSFHTADKTATKVRKQNTTLAAKDLLQVQFTFTEGDWKSSEEDTPGALKGVFSVSATKQVHFSKGNLRYVVGTQDWSFYEHQYDFCHTETYTGHHSDTISLFTWGYDATQSVIPNGTSSVAGHTTAGDELSKSEDWGYVFGGESSVWRTLTTDEWQYLFSYNESSYGGKNYDNDTRRGLYKAGVNVCGSKDCVVLLPDGWEWDESTVGIGWQTGGYPETSTENNPVTWQKMEDAGAVCLPTAGFRDGSKVTSVGIQAGYWSSSVYDAKTICHVSITSNSVVARNGASRTNGNSVRLVTNVSAAPTPTEPASEYVEIKALYNGTDSTSLKWYRQNLAITGSGNNPWKGKNSSAVKVPGTDKDVIVGDYFQWAAYENYALPENDLGNDKTDKGLLIYASFTNQFCVGGGDEDKFVFKMPEQNKEYYFNPSFLNEGYVCISPYYSGGYTKYISGSVNLDSSDDVARIILGDGWRMPTQAEFSAMKNATYWAWDGEDCGYYVFTPYVSTAAGQIGNIAGLDKSDALLFFPAAGYGFNSEFTQAGAVGYYWSGTPSDDTNSAHCLNFYNNGVDLQCFSPRNYGHAVRPVSD